MATECYRCGQEGHRRSECPQVFKVPPATRPPAVAEKWEELEDSSRSPAALPWKPAELSDDTKQLIERTRADLQIRNTPRLRRWLTQEELDMWTVRDSPRGRRTFGLPHAGDFIGTGQTPREYPA
jgi:hypothetical protein